MYESCGMVIDCAFGQSRGMWGLMRRGRLIIGLREKYVVWSEEREKAARWKV